MFNPSETESWRTFIREEAELDPDNVTIKKDIATKYGRQGLVQSWVAVCNALRTITKEIKARQSDAFPIMHYDEFFALSEAEKECLKQRGTFVIRGTIPEATAVAWYEELAQYVETNKERITGWPKETPFIKELYWTKTQLNTRTHPRHMALQRALNSLWHDDDDPEKSFAAPFAYAEPFRMRPPKIRFTGLGPHVDGGSMCRWGEEKHQRMYEAIWSGRVEEWDPYDMTVRKSANPAYYPGHAQSRVLRTFQGWTALTPAGPGEGSLMAYPDVKYAIAYVLLRPFFRPPVAEADLLDPTKWTLDLEDAWFPGVWRHTSQLLCAKSYPHLELTAMPNIPAMRPGDTVWWHCDMIHAVEVEHNGPGIASVAYCAACPTTDINKEYIHAQMQDMLAGKPPADHRGQSKETDNVGFAPESYILNGLEGRRACGLATA